MYLTAKLGPGEKKIQKYTQSSVYKKYSHGFRPSMSIGRVV